MFLGEKGDMGEKGDVGEPGKLLGYCILSHANHSVTHANHYSFQFEYKTINSAAVNI